MMLTLQHSPLALYLSDLQNLCLCVVHTPLLQINYFGQSFDSLWKSQLIQENKNEWLWRMKEKPFPAETMCDMWHVYVALYVFNHVAIQYYGYKTNCWD